MKKSNQEILDEVFEYTKTNRKSLAELVGAKSKQIFYDIYSGKTKEITNNVTSLILKKFPEINEEFLLTGKGKLTNEIQNSTIKEQSNAKLIGELEHYDYLVDTKFIEISPGRYKMRVPLVPEYARAGYLSGFSDKEYMESLPIHEPIVDKYHRGRYMAFEVSGDSMDDDSKRSVPHGSIVTAREIKRELWRSKFHTHRYPYYVIIHKTDGILIKEMIKHDTENGIITLHSLNQDKDEYPDFDVHLDDVQQIFNVVKKEETY